MLRTRHSQEKRGDVQVQSPEANTLHYHYAEELTTQHRSIPVKFPPGNQPGYKLLGSIKRAFSVYMQQALFPQAQIKHTTGTFMRPGALASITLGLREKN